MADSLGGRMKSYEQVTRLVLLPHSYTILRVDGRAFHSYLRDAVKPFDLTFMGHMVDVAKVLCEEISGSVFAYGQSDEISLLLCDIEPQSQPWFGGVVQKMASVAAGLTTVALVSKRGWDSFPHFDARVFTLPSAMEVANYFIWRQRDAVRNSVSMAAQAKFSPRQLHGVSGDQMQEMLWREHQINWNDYPAECKRGWVVVRAERIHRPADRQTGETIPMVTLRTFWGDAAAPPFTSHDGGWLAGMIPALPTLAKEENDG